LWCIAAYLLETGEFFPKNRRKKWQKADFFVNCKDIIQEINEKVKQTAQKV